MKRSAFTMIELIFVIVVLGILASIAIPKLTATRTDAQITKGINDVSVIRSSIVTTRSASLLSGDATFPAMEKDTADDMLFDGILDYPIKEKAASSNNGWSSNERDSKTYTLAIDGTAVIFEYNNITGIFTCRDKNVNDDSKELCDQLIR
jgi:general secretion pathway protein G